MRRKPLLSTRRVGREGYFTVSALFYRVIFVEFRLILGTPITTVWIEGP